MGFILCPNGYLMIPDRFRYFLDDFWNSEHLVKIWTRRPPNYYQNASQNTRKYGIILGKYYLCQYRTQRMLDVFEKCMS